MTETNQPIALPAPVAEQGSVETVPLFTIGDEEFRIPAKPRVNLALKYLHQAKTIGEDKAAANLLAALLGDEGFAALAEYDDLTPEQFDAVMAAAQKHTLGALEKTRGNGQRGPRK